MPITKSAIKRMRSNERKFVRNQMIRSELKTLFKKVAALADRDLEKAKLEAKQLESKFDKAAHCGVIPKERANRKKSRLAALLSKSKSG